MNRLAWTARDAARKLGPPGWAALALLAACAFWWLAAYLPELSHAEALRDENRTLDERLANVGPAREDTDSPLQQLAAFERGLPADKEITASLATLQTLAVRHALVLDQAEFKLVADAGDTIARYAISLPLKADYRALRRFIRAAMDALPSLALEEVSVRRVDAKSPVLEARLRFVLFVSARP